MCYWHLYCVQLIVQHARNDGLETGNLKLARKEGITDDELVMTTTSMCARARV